MLLGGKTQEPRLEDARVEGEAHKHGPLVLLLRLVSCSLESSDGSPFGRFDVGVDADDDGQAVDRGGGGLVSVAAGDRERLASGGRFF